MSNAQAMDIMLLTCFSKPLACLPAHRRLVGRQFLCKLMSVRFDFDFNFDSIEEWFFDNHVLNINCITLRVRVLDNGTLVTDFHFRIDYFWPHFQCDFVFFSLLHLYYCII